MTYPRTNKLDAALALTRYHGGDSIRFTVGTSLTTSAAISAKRRIAQLAAPQVEIGRSLILAARGKKCRKRCCMTAASAS